MKSSISTEEIMRNMIRRQRKSMQNQQREKEKRKEAIKEIKEQRAERFAESDSHKLMKAMMRKRWGEIFERRCYDVGRTSDTIQKPKTEN